MNWFIYVWVTIAVIIIVGSVFWSGYDTATPSWEKEGFIGNAVFFAVCWPFLLGLALAFAIIVGPFYGVYCLGKYLSPKK